MIIYRLKHQETRRILPGLPARCLPDWRVRLMAGQGRGERPSGGHIWLYQEIFSLFSSSDHISERTVVMVWRCRWCCWRCLPCMIWCWCWCGVRQNQYWVAPLLCPPSAAAEREREPGLAGETQEINDSSSSRSSVCCARDGERHENMLWQQLSSRNLSLPLSVPLWGLATSVPGSRGASSSE